MQGFEHRLNRAGARRAEGRREMVGGGEGRTWGFLVGLGEPGRGGAGLGATEDPNSRERVAPGLGACFHACPFFFIKTGDK